MNVQHQGQVGFLSGGGDMGARIRAFDWSKTALGPVEQWPQSLRTAVSMLLPSKAQIILFWGKEFVGLYNDAYAPVFGQKHPDMLGQPASIAWREIWETQLRELFEGVVRTGEAFHARDLEFILERYGFLEETYFDVSYDPVRDETGNVGGIFCIVTETTARVVGERRLALLKDLAGATVGARSAREACERAVAVMAGKKPVRFALAYLGDSLVASTPEAEALLARSGPEHVRELPIPTGKLILGMNPRRPFNEEYADYFGLVAGQLGTAITNAEAYEDERKRAEALAEIDRAKTAFFSNVSHEFRTPLTLMLGPVSELLAGERTDAERSTLELIERNAERLQKLVNTLLDFSRIEAGRLEARFSPVALAEVTRDLASAFRSTVERERLSLVVECEPIADQVYVDRELWEKIVLNLISNAFKHTFEGSISVRLRSEAGHAVLTVSDTGIGIPADHVDRVFDRFHRVPSARSRTHEGSGIGLSLVRELVRMHGGDVRVTSSVGHGSSFIVSIPIGRSHLPPELVSDTETTARAGSATMSKSFVREASSWADWGAPEQQAAASDSTILGGALVLVVDDNHDMRNYLSRVLTAAGARVALAPDGRNALTRMRTVVPDLVLADVMMPGLDGFGLLAEMRSDERLRTVPFIMLSARAGEESRIGGLSAGADDYLVKPFIAKELVARVAAQLRIARLSAAERRARAEADEARREMSRVFEQAPVPICVFEGEELLYTSANASYRQIIGNRDPVGKRLLQLWPELAGSEIHGVFQQVLATRRSYSAKEFRIQFDQFGTGELRDSFFNFVYHPLLDGTGRAYGIIAVATDVTAHVLARHEAERLRQAAESANEAKLHLLRTVSHETRQPVHASLGYLDLLGMGIRGPLNDAQRSDIENIRRNQNHLLRLLNDILSFAKLEAGALELDIENADAVEIIEAVESLVEPQFRAKGVEYVAKRAGEPAVFRGDRERTVQVCVNLLTNALKATPAGGCVTIACDIKPDTIDLRVSDTGIGIPESKFNEIFDPFTQLARVRATQEARGVGLGLSISRQLARAMKGDVTVESIEGVGSTFTFTLPRVSRPSQQTGGTTNGR